MIPFQPEQGVFSTRASPNISTETTPPPLPHINPRGRSFAEIPKSKIISTRWQTMAFLPVFLGNKSELVLEDIFPKNVISTNSQPSVNNTGRSHACNAECKFHKGSNATGAYSSQDLLQSGVTKQPFTFTYLITQGHIALTPKPFD